MASVEITPPTTSSENPGKEEAKAPAPDTRTSTDVKVLVAGAADAGKSSTIGVLVYGELDDPNNQAADKIDLHAHERERNTTSSVSTHSMIEGSRSVSLINLCGQKEYLKHTILGMSGHYADYGMLLINVNKGVTEITLEHINILVHLNIPFLVIVTKMDLCTSKDLYLKVHKEIRDTLKKYELRTAHLKVNVNYELTEDYIPYVDYLISRSNVVPVLSICTRPTDGKFEADASGKPIPIPLSRGRNITQLRDLLFRLRSRPLWTPAEIANNVFFINKPYQVAHVGIVVAGVTKSLVPVKQGEQWFVGPYGSELNEDTGELKKESRFLEVKIKSCHNEIRQDVDELSDGESGCICIRFPGKDALTRDQIHKGMILTNDPSKLLVPEAKLSGLRGAVVSNFTATITVLQHHTSIRTLYQSVVHLGPIRQSARILLPKLIVADEKEDIEKTIAAEAEASSATGKKTRRARKETRTACLRTGDKAVVGFQWLFNQEYVEIGTKFFAREGNCRIAGEVTTLGLPAELCFNLSSTSA
jgi:GTPase